MDYRETVYNNFRLFFFDTAGEERFHSVSRKMMRNMDVVVFCFDLSKVVSFNNLIYWINLFKTNGNDKANLIVCALKKDLPPMI